MLQRFRVERARQHGRGSRAQAGAGERRVAGRGDADARHRSGTLQAIDPGQHRVGRRINLDDHAIEMAARQQAFGFVDRLGEFRDCQAAAQRPAERFVAAGCAANEEQ